MEKDMERDMEKDLEKDMELEKSPQDPFAGEEVGGVRYRTMKWWNCAICIYAPIGLINHGP
jgi:hypothetical protein